MDAGPANVRYEVIRVVSGAAYRESGVKAEGAVTDPRESAEQRRLAGERAKMVRAHRLRIRQELRAGTVNLADLLRDPPHELMTAKVLDLLLALPNYGRVKANRILKHARISPSKTVGGLSERQREELLSFCSRSPQDPPEGLY